MTFIYLCMFIFFNPDYKMFYLNGKSYLHVSRLSSIESRLPPIHVVEVNRAVKLLFSVSSPDFSKK